MAAPDSPQPLDSPGDSVPESQPGAFPWSTRLKSPGLVREYTVALAVFALAPLCISVAVGVSMSTAMLTSSAERRLQSLGQAKLAQAHAQLARRTADTRMLARMAWNLAEDFPNVDAGEFASPQASQAASRWLRSQAALLGEDIELHVVSLDGRELAASTLNHPVIDWSGHSGVAEGRYQTWSRGPGYSGPAGDGLLVVATPLRTTAGTTVGELVLLEGADALDSWLVTDAELPVALRLYDFSGRLMGAWPSGQAQAWSDTISTRVSVQPGGGWLEIGSPRQAALADLLWLRNMAVAGLVISAVLLVAVAGWMGRRLTRPLVRLAGTVQRFGQGDLQPFEIERRADEIGLLSSAAEEMRTALLALRTRDEERLRRKADALADREGLIASLFEVLPEYVVVLAADFKILAANRTARKLHGDSPVGRSCHQAIFGLDSQCVDCPLRAASVDPLGERQPHHANCLGQVMAFQLRAIEGAPDSPAAWVYTGRILTEENRLRAQVIHQERMAMTGILAAGVAHEIGNPLAAMLGVLRVGSGAGRSLGDGQVALVREQVERISVVLKGLLGVARASSTQAGPVLVNGLVERAVQLVRYDPRASSDCLTMTLDQDIPFVWGVEDRLLQALLNVLINAVDEVEGRIGAQVSVWTRATDDGLEVGVRDSGGGMDPDTLKHACDPLFTTKPVGRGTGLGLHVTQEIIHEMGGSLEIRSAPGVGTTVRFLLPGRRWSGGTQ